MQKKIWLLALVVAAVLLSAGPFLADDGFYVIGGCGGVGTKITSLPKIIGTPGFYYMTDNLIYSGSGRGITVNSDKVTIDLMGYYLSGPGYVGGVPGFPGVRVGEGGHFHYLRISHLIHGYSPTISTNL